MKLKEFIINDQLKHPERLNATFERIEEVIGLVLKGNAKSLVKKCREILNQVENDRGELTEHQGEQIANIIEGFASLSDVGKIKELLAYSELSTEEAIQLHEEFKIPVSRLEKDIVPVVGDGCWIVDTKGERYLDLDSKIGRAHV